MQRMHEVDQQFKQIDKYIITNDVLGKGQFGTVKRGFFKDDINRRVAVKIIPLSNAQQNQQLLKQLRTEIDILMKVKNKYIIEMYHATRTPNNLYMFLEYCGEGDLKGLLNKRGGHIMESEAIVYFRQICEGFKTLYDLKIIHRDIKPANILVKEGRAYISDFGFAKCLDSIIGMEQQIQQTLLGTPLYMSPQIIKEENFSSKCDIWSLGMVFYEMLYGKTPWKGMSCQKLLQDIEQTPLKFPSYPQTSEMVQDMLKKMLQINESDRIGWPDLFEHPLIKLDINDVKAKLTQIQNQDGDQLLKSVEMNKFYCNNNRVIGIDKQQQAQTFNLNDNSSHTTASQAEGGEGMGTTQSNVKNGKEVDIQEYYNKQKIADKLRQKDLQIDSFLLFERNIGIFINLSANYVFKHYQKQAIQVAPQLFFRVIFVLQKKQLIRFQFLLDLMDGKAFPQNNFYSQEDLAHYQKAKEYNQTKQIIKNDNMFIKPYFEGIYEKNKNICSQFPNDPVIQEFSKILNDDFNVDNKEFDFVYNKTLDQFLQQDFKLQQPSQNSKRDLLQTILYLIICKQPYDRFKIDVEDPVAQFHQFYYKYDKQVSEEEIYQEIRTEMQKSIKY